MNVHLLLFRFLANEPLPALPGPMNNWWWWWCSLVPRPLRFLLVLLLWKRESIANSLGLILISSSLISLTWWVLLIFLIIPIPLLFLPIPCCTGIPSINGDYDLMNRQKLSSNRSQLNCDLFLPLYSSPSNSHSHIKSNYLLWLHTRPVNPQQVVKLKEKKSRMPLKNRVRKPS